MSTQTAAGDGARPGAPAATAPRWYRRRPVLLGGGIAVVVAIAVVTDLPTPTSHAADLASAAAFVKEVNTDLRACGFALQEAYAFRQDQLNGSLSAKDRASVPTLLSDDAVACSYIDPSVTDLTSLESPETTAAQPIGQMVATVTTWVTVDALGAVEAVESLWAHPADLRAQRALRHYTALLARDRADANRSIAQADAQLDTDQLHVDLPVVRVPSAATPAT
ncbi:MAG TPA: hypothetical protein VGZ03_11380, partial [Acidimicrobiales bacterium]|nr:hypothetical protein [Acidimicrobiales bacterium]